MRPDGTDRQLLRASLAQGFGVGWSPDSLRIAWDERGGINVIGADGLGETRLDLSLEGLIEDVAWRR